MATAACVRPPGALAALPVTIRRKAFRSSDRTEVLVIEDGGFELAAHQFTCLVVRLGLPGRLY